MCPVYGNRFNSTTDSADFLATRPHTAAVIPGKPAGNPLQFVRNLDNWKSSRRKRVEHIIERCVEVRRMEHEPSQPRAKSKTFNEMLEERSVPI
ncbi:hypothetical protein SFRURICE_005555 [Spodoptera frugiperda]|nr:hypothetical protein SFRURICE_005555 [Spodoptera frugiperda]